VALIANARMYSVTPVVEAAWQGLLARVLAMAEITLDYIHYPAPQPMEGLWSRPDLGAVFMCGYPIALNLAEVEPIAAPIPSLDWAEGKPLYRSDLIVRADSPFRTLEDTFGHKAGWTVEHSHSGFNAFRHHLLTYRRPDRPRLFGSVTGSLITARAILDSVRNGTIDIGPLDAYWHALIAKHAPDLVSGIRSVDHTALAPLPAFVAGKGVDSATLHRLKQAFVAASNEDWFAQYRDALLLKGFAAVSQSDYATTLAWDREAMAAGYEVPA
jgi:ABC-type phosphate/phosphonate transport system substrate-binding protein